MIPITPHFHLSSPVSRISPPPDPELRICGVDSDCPLVTIKLRSGDITYGPDYQPDEAARIFWEALALAWPR